MKMIAIIKKTKIMYTEEFIKEVKELYPVSSEMHRHAESGNMILGRYLDDSSSNSIPIKEVLNATSLEELKAKALTAKRKVDLYIKWAEQVKS